MEEQSKIETNHKVYELFEENKGLIQADDLFLLVNGKLLTIGDTPIKAKEIFMKMDTETGRIIGWSPLQTLELNEGGQFIAGKNLVSFVTKDGAKILISKVRNKLIMWNDKDVTENVQKVFNHIMRMDIKEDIRKENDFVKKLRDNDYEMLTIGNYSFMHKDKSEPYLFMEANDELTVLSMKQVYENEDSVKYKIENQNKELLHDLKNNKIIIS